MTARPSHMRLADRMMVFEQGKLSTVLTEKIADRIDSNTRINCIINWDYLRNSHSTYHLVCFCQAQELSLARGEIAPEKRISIVEHLESGIVYKVLVDETLAKSELQQLEAKRLTLLSDIKREKSLVEETTYQSMPLNTALHNNEADVSVQEILKSQKELQKLQLKTLMRNKR